MIESIITHILFISVPDLLMNNNYGITWGCCLSYYLTLIHTTTARLNYNQECITGVDVDVNVV